MPSLKAFGRRWSIGSDDFVFPEIIEAVIRITWIFIVVCIYALHMDPRACSEQRPGSTHSDLTTFTIVLAVYNLITVGFCCVAAYISSRGTIMDAAPRRKLTYLIYLRMPFFVFEIIWNIVGTVWLSEARDACDKLVSRGITVTVIINWLMIVAFLFGLFMVFNPVGHVHRLTAEKAKRLWKFRLKLLFLCASADDNAKAAFEDVADLMTTFFDEDDLVLSDVWTGMLLLAHSNNNNNNNGDYSALVSRSFPVNSSEGQRPEWMNPVLAARMIDFAIGVYGWLNYSLNNCTCSAQYALIFGKCHCRCMPCAGGNRQGDEQSENGWQRKDNLCRTNTTAFLLSTGIPNSHLFYVSFENRIYENPFVVCVDEQTKSLIVAIRGTSSLRDVITDLCAADQSFPYHNSSHQTVEEVIETEEEEEAVEAIESGTSRNHLDKLCQDRPDIRVHRGIMNSATRVYRILQEEQILDTLLKEYPDYQLVITGHSLGAGVAALLAFLLRCQYPNVRCFCFSPPGSVISPGTALDDMQEFVMCIVLGDDMFARLSIQSIQRMKRNLLGAIGHCQRAKYEILLKGCFRLLCGAATESGPIEPLQNVVPVSATTDENAQVSETPRIGKDTSPLINGRTSSASDYGTDEDFNGRRSYGTELTLPGRIMLLTVDLDEQTRPIVQWVSSSRFTNIKLVSGMLSDHLPYNVRDVLRLAAATTPDTWDLVV